MDSSVLWNAVIAMWEGSEARASGHATR
jgi:hypothetical protein